MKLGGVLKLRKSEQSNEKIDLNNVLKLRKAKKYIKRTGSPGSYKYIYKEKKPKSSKEYIKEHGVGIRKEADELKRMSDEDFKRKKEKYDKKKLKEALIERQVEKKPKAMTTDQIKKLGYQTKPSKGELRAIDRELIERRKLREGAKKKKDYKRVMVERADKQENKKIEVQTLPQDINTLTIDNVTSLIKQSVKLNFKKLRENQNIVEQQKVQVYKQKDAKAYRRFEVMENIYQAAVDIKKFKFTTAGAWAKEIIGKIKQYKDD